ncbi:hypothetical protein Tco_0057936 [Tanacetum coccineum]
MTMEILPEPTSNKLCGRSDAYAGNHVKEILLNLNLPDHMSVLTEPEVHVMTEMEIPRSSKVNHYVFKMKQSKGDNPIAFKIKKGMSMSVRRLQDHKEAKDYKIMQRDDA